MLRWFTKLLDRNQYPARRRATRTIVRSRPRARVRLGFELLEDRTVPSANPFTVNFPGHPGLIPVQSDDAATLKLLGLFQGPSISITLPDGTLTNVNQNLPVNGTITDNSGTGIATATESLDGGTPVSILPLGGVEPNFTYAFDLGTVAFPPAIIPDGTHTLTISATDDAGGSNSGSVTFTVDTVAPTATVTPVGNNPTNASSVQFAVSFSKTVTGLSAANFTVTPGGGVTGGSVTNITGSGANYTVTVGGYTDAVSAGSETLALANSTGLTDLAGNAVTGLPVSGTINIDQIAPTLVSIDTTAANPTNATSLPFDVHFSKPVVSANVVAGDFTVVTTGTATDTGFSITPVTVGTTSQDFTVTVNGVSFTTNGATLGLNMTSAGTVQDPAGNPLSTANIPFTGQTYTLENGPSVTSTSSTPNPTNQTTATFVVTFDQPVNGVQANNFTLTQTGATGTIGTVTPVGSAPTATWDVSVTGIGITTPGSNGTLTLNVNQNLSEITGVGGAPMVTPFTTGTALTVDMTAPTVTSITIPVGAQNPTRGASGVSFLVTFSEPVNNVALADFGLATTNSAAGTISSILPVTGPSSTYTVTVTGVSGTGNLGLNLTSTGTIVDTAGNALSATTPVVGATYAIDNTPPVTPTLTLASAFQASPTPNPTVSQISPATLQGVTSPNATVTLQSPPGTVIATTTADGSGNFSFTNVSLPNSASGDTITNVADDGTNATFTTLSDDSTTFLTPGTSVTVVNVPVTGGVNFNGTYTIATVGTGTFTVPLTATAVATTAVATGNAVVSSGSNQFAVFATDSLGNMSTVFDQDILQITTNLQIVNGPNSTTASHTAGTVVDAASGGVPITYNTNPANSNQLLGLGFDVMYDGTQFTFPTAAISTIAAAGATATITLQAAPQVPLQVGDAISISGTSNVGPNHESFDGSYSIKTLTNGGLTFTIKSPHADTFGAVSASGTMTLLLTNVTDPTDFFAAQVLSPGDLKVTYASPSNSTFTNSALPITLVNVPFITTGAATAGPTTVSFTNGVPASGDGFSFFSSPFTITLT